MEYYSDSDTIKQAQTITDIPHNFWRALVSKIEDAFTEEREENWRKIKDTTRLQHFSNQVMGVVPLAPQPDPLIICDDWGNSVTPSREVTLNIIQFCYKFMYGREQERFISEINLLFERNALAFKLLDTGNIEKLVNPILSNTLTRLEHSTGDVELDILLDKAVSKFLRHAFQERKESLEHLWDAFERIKTLNGADKKTSIEQLNLNTSLCKDFRDVINVEATNLSYIGNNFMIRHSETSKPPIAEDAHVDFLFHRMFALIWLWLDTLENQKKTNTQVQNNHDWRNAF